MKRSCLVACVLLLAPPASADWMVELLAGTAYNFPSTLTIDQEGQPDISFSARYVTKPLEGDPYYAVRLSRQGKQGAWELHFMHDKLFLTNEQPEVSKFHVTHGFNMLTLDRSWHRLGVDWRVGLGLVAVHAEANIRGESVGTQSNWDVSGPVVALGVGRRWSITDHVHLGLEARATAARARTSFPDASAEIDNIALHGHLGFGYRF